MKTAAGGVPDQPRLVMWAQRTAICAEPLKTNRSGTVAGSVGEMKSIWKYELKVRHAQVVPMPAGARILTVQMQNFVPVLWAVVDPDAKREPRMFLIFGTGHPYDADDATYIGTVQDGQLVWHVFEARK